MENNCQTVKEKFSELFNKEALIIRSPGRINLIGEHTDYNNGFVMPAAIDKEIVFAFALSPEGETKIHSLNYDETFHVDLENPERLNNSHWANYLLGVIRSLQLKGHTLKPFVCVVGSNIPMGAGLSSSAAFECGFVFGMNELNRLGLSKIDMILTAQWAEHNYAGVLCGIMDQFSSMMGKEGNVIVLDCQDLSSTYFPFHAPSYQLILMDSRVKHSLASTEYNTRRHECETGVKLLQNHYPQIKTLRDVTLEMLKEHGSSLPDKVYSRCLYVVEEIQRVQAASKDLKAGDIIGFGTKMFTTHHGLSKLYEVSCEELDFLVDKASTMEGVAGARMMGGGFGGCTINIVSEQVVDAFISNTSEKYKEKFGVDPVPYKVNITNGTGICETEKINN